MPTPTSASSRNPTRWVGLPAEDRRAERRTLLLDAAFELLGTEGWSGTSVRSVCHVARLNPRYFYESFDDLDALIVAVYDRLVEELRGVVVSAIEASGDPRDQVRTAFHTLLSWVDADRRRGRVLYVEALGNEALNRRRIETGHALVSLLEQSGIERHGPPPKGEAIGRVVAAVIVGGSSELVIAWLDGRIQVPLERLADDASELLLAMADAAAAIAARRA